MPDVAVNPFAAVATYTLRICQRCPVPYACCSRYACDAARKTAPPDAPYNAGAPLPYMGVNGCTLAPEYRPMCALYVCADQLTATERHELSALRSTALTGA